MERKRVTLKVEVDLDPVPGTFNHPQDYVDLLSRHLKQIIPHYNPVVTLVPIPECDELSCDRDATCEKKVGEHWFPVCNYHKFTLPYASLPGNPSNPTRPLS